MSMSAYYLSQTVQIGPCFDAKLDQTLAQEILDRVEK